MRDLSLREDSTSPNYIPFACVHTISTGDWTEAYGWSRDNYRELRITGGEYVAVSRTVQTVVTDERAARLSHELTQNTFNTFDEFKAAKKQRMPD